MPNLPQIIRKLSTVLVLITSACGGGAGVSSSSATVKTSDNASVSLTPTPTPTPVVPTPAACQGTATPAPATVLYAPAVPQPATANDLVGINIQNTASTASGSRYTTFGQVFIAGQVLPTNTLVASINGTTTPVQMGALATWPDGSVKLAALTLKAPDICANSQIAAMFSKSTASPTTAAVDLAASKPGLTATVNFTAGSYTGTQTIDLGAALQTALKSKPDYWLQGPLVTQARVDVPLADGRSTTSSTLHLTADVSVFADGTAMADVQFNNDLTTVLPQSGSVNPQGPLTPLAYTTTIDFQGKQIAQNITNHTQYSDWHATVWTAPAPQLNVQRDIAQLQRSGAILPYDLATGVNNTLPQSYDVNIMQKVGFGAPLAGNGLSTYMPGTGGRPDIGFTTQYNTVWLLTQDARAAKVALAQSDTSGAIPWNYKLANKRWLTPADYPKVWADGRGGPHGGNDGLANLPNTTTWTTDTAHQPNLNYVPYVMTGVRWHLDRLNAQAAFNLITSWTGYRCKTPQCNTLINGGDQVRAQAWGFRELKQAAFIGHTSSAEQAIFHQAVSDNWTYLKTQLPILLAAHGEVTGWLPGANGTPTATPEWSQDFMTVIALMAAQMGDADARDFLIWQTPWLSGRFVGNGMNPYDGCNFSLMVADPITAIAFSKWTDIAVATVRANYSNGSGWSQSDGYYCSMARSALNGAIIHNTNNFALKQALSWLKNANAPYTSQAAYRNDPTFNINVNN